MNIQDLLGAVTQSGMSRSTTARIKSSLGGGGLLDGLAGMLGGASAGGSAGGLGGMLGGSARQTSQGGASGGFGGSLGGLGGTLGNVLNEAGRMVGGNQNLALGGLGALAGALLGSRRGLGGAVRGGLGGGVMAVLGAMAFQALKNRAGQPTRVPLGLAAPQTEAEQQELERNSELVLKAMINAAKADGQIDEREIRRILGKVKKSGADPEGREFLTAEMRKPMQTAELVEAARGNPELAAQLYGASLLAIEVDTPAEKQYLAELAAGLGLGAEVTARIQQALGVAPA
jgi:uncharacterized membrane protein YebE (DUF533 family)